MFGIGVAESEILGSEIPLLQVVSMMALKEKRAVFLNSIFRWETSFISYYAAFNSLQFLRSKIRVNIES